MWYLLRRKGLETTDPHWLERGLWYVSAFSPCHFTAVLHGSPLLPGSIMVWLLFLFRTVVSGCAISVFLPHRYTKPFAVFSMCNTLSYFYYLHIFANVASSAWNSHFYRITSSSLTPPVCFCIWLTLTHFSRCASTHFFWLWHGTSRPT